MTFTVRTRVRTPSLEQTAENRETDGGLGGLGSPRHARPLAWKGSPREEQTDTVETECPRPETGAGPTGLPPPPASQWGSMGGPRAARTTQLGRYGFEEMSSWSGQEGMGS